MTTQLDATAQSLRERLLEGQFGRQGKLREQGLAESLNVSRTVIRLALSELEREGLVTREPNKGYRVRSFTLDEVADAILVRGELEGMAARLCAERGLSDEQRAALQAPLDALDALLAGGVDRLEQRLQWLELNACFHDALVAASGNKSLADTIRSLSRLPLVTSRAIVFDTQDRGHNLPLLEAAQRDHWNVLDAIVARQGGRAEYMMREHARRSAENKRKNFDAMRAHAQSPALPGLALVSG